MGVLKVKPTNSMSGHRNLQNVAVSKEHIFYYNLSTVPIIFTHIMYHVPMERTGCVGFIGVIMYNKTSHGVQPYHHGNQATMQ